MILLSCCFKSRNLVELIGYLWSIRFNKNNQLPLGLNIWSLFTFDMVGRSHGFLSEILGFRALSGGSFYSFIYMFIKR